MKFLLVDTAYVEGLWPLVEPFIKKYCEWSENRISAETMKSRILSDHNQLWLAYQEEKQNIQAVVVTQIFIEDTGNKTARVVAAAGENRREWVPILDVIEEWAKVNDCIYLQMQARKGWLKDLPDYRAKRILLEKQLVSEEHG